MDNLDNRRFILLFALAFVGLLLYQAWMRDYGVPVSNDSKPQMAETSIPAKSNLPEIPANSVTSTTPTLSENSSAIAPAPVQEDAVRQAKFVTVVTDVLQAEISVRGGTLENLHLLGYPLTPEQPEIKFQLFKPEEPSFYVAQSGLVGSKDAIAPAHDAVFDAIHDEYRLETGKENLSVDLVWVNESGIKVTKRFTFKRGSYLIGLEQIVENKSTHPWTMRAYVQLQRSKPIESKEASFAKSYTGAAFYSAQDKYKKLSFDEIANAPYQKAIANGWIAMVQHYFLAAWVANVVNEKVGVNTVYTSQAQKSKYTIGMYSPSVTIPVEQTHIFKEQLFVGPKLQNELAKIATGLDLTVDYGWLTVIAHPIFWLLNSLHYLFGNWGWAIIFLTILIKLAFYKLSEISYKSMAEMRKITPKMQELKDRYGEDKERLNQAMMDLYKKEKVNPLGGCLPIVVQIPVFIALYWVLLESVEMRQAPFALWINNLSGADPYFVLPLIMGISMFVQQQLNPAPMDPMQAKVMMGMPLIFTVFFAFFPSGLVLYWVVNNVLSIAQQWYIVRVVEAEETKRLAAKIHNK